MIDAGAALIGMAWCFGLGCLATWWVCYLWWHGSGGDDPGPQDPPPPREGGPASDLDALEHYALIDDFVMQDAHNAIRIL